MEGRVKVGVGLGLRLCLGQDDRDNGGGDDQPKLHLERFVLNKYVSFQLCS